MRFLLRMHQQLRSKCANQPRLQPVTVRNFGYGRLDPLAAVKLAERRECRCYGPLSLELRFGWRAVYLQSTWLSFEPHQAATVQDASAVCWASRCARGCNGGCALQPATQISKSTELVEAPAVYQKLCTVVICVTYLAGMPLADKEPSLSCCGLVLAPRQNRSSLQAELAQE